jgi:hypothetical protein
MQYLYLFIFVFFILLNVVIGLASQRAKKRRAAGGKVAGSESADNGFPGNGVADDGVAGDEVAKESAPSIATEAVPEQRRQRAFTESMLKPQTARNIVETLFEEPKPMIDISRPDEAVELSIEKNLLESEVASRAVEKQKEQDEKYQSHDLYRYQDVEASAWERINGLSPLKRAIILSELLGPPRALSEGRNSE